MQASNAPVTKSNRIRWELSQGPSSTSEMAALTGWEKRFVSALLCNLAQCREVEVIAKVTDIEGNVNSLYSLTLVGIREVKRRKLSAPSDAADSDDTVRW